ncbi:MAG TPA: class I SAM-dependent methyltransferase [Caulifigura sp.]|nr:class I SAM-dependent methyltransferase [Caulifigura sp.]
MRALGLDVDSNRFIQEHEFAEGFFQLLGAGSVDALDASPFEGTNITHDLNIPIPAEHHGRFSVVYDGGSLEHVFQFPTALRSCLQMVKPGGHFLQHSEANNFCGHGFWQLSPELLFRALSPENGFRLKAVFLREDTPGAKWYLVRDPAAVGHRVELCNSTPTYIFAIAQRISLVEPFASPPQQSDYSAIWKKYEGAQQAHPSRIPQPSILHRLVPRSVKVAIKSVLKPSFNASDYAPISDADFLQGKLPFVGNGSAAG